MAAAPGARLPPKKWEACMARIAIVGCGAMGSVYAALMADAGHEVWAVDIWQDHVRAIRDKGLRVDGASGRDGGRGRGGGGSRPVVGEHGHVVCLLRGWG